jgi:addiction module HigA family antidote
LLRRFTPRNDGENELVLILLFAIAPRRHTSQGISHGVCGQARQEPLSHPSRALLRDEIIPATGRTKSEIAELLGISRQHLYDLLQEKKPVSPTVAVRLGKLFGDGAGIWTRMQAAYDTWQAERTEDVSQIPTIKVKAA